MVALLRWLNTLPEISVDLKTISEYIDEESEKSRITEENTATWKDPRRIPGIHMFGRPEEQEPMYLPLNNPRPDPLPGLWASSTSTRTQNHSCVEPPSYFLPGESSIPDGENSVRMFKVCLLYTSPSPRDGLLSRMPSSA